MLAMEWAKPEAKRPAVGTDAVRNSQDFGTSRCGASLTLHLSNRVRKGLSFGNAMIFLEAVAADA
jgi:hypothetical protein